MRFSQSLVLRAGARRRFDVELQTADPVWPIFTHDRRRNQVPTEVLRKNVRGDLALVERSGRKIAQRHFTATRLVDTVATRVIVASQQRGERVVRAPWDQL